MIPLVLLCALIGLPVLMGLLLRVNAVFIFLGLAVGDMMVRYISDDAAVAASAFSRSPLVPVATRLTMLLLPVLLCLWLLKKSLPTSKILLQLVPLGVVGLAVASLAVPLLPEALQNDIFALPAGNILRQSQDIVVSLAAGLSLLLAFHDFRGSRAHRKHR